MGLSVSVLKALKSSGVYEVNHLLPTRVGFHELDLNIFTKKLLDLAPNQKTCSIQGEGTVTVRSIVCGRRDSLEIKLKLARGLLPRSIAAFGNSNETVGGLVIEESAYH